MSTHYNRCSVSKDNPSVTMSRNTFCKLFHQIGMDINQRKLLYQRHMGSKAADHQITIDGTLKQDTNAINDLSTHSYKARAHYYIIIMNYYLSSNSSPISVFCDSFLIIL